MYFFEPYISDIKNYIADYQWYKKPENLYNPLKYFLTIGGKHIRPIVTLWSVELFDLQYKKYLDSAMAVEFFHNFSLIHDDIMDNAVLRRGKDTVHQKWDTNVAILSGDALLIKAYTLFDRLDAEIYKTAIHEFNKMALAVCEGQQMDLDFSKENTISIAQYLEMITKKTAVLLAYAAQLGGILVKTTPQNQENLYQFALHLGIAFQLQDDYLDVFEESKNTGKIKGGDVFENKKTILYLLALAHLSKEDQIVLENWYKKTDYVVEKYDAVVELMHKANVVELVQEMILDYSQKARNYLIKIKSENSKEKLFNLIDYLIQRKV